MAVRAWGTPLENARIAFAGRIQDLHDDERLGIMREDEHYVGGFHHDTRHAQHWTYVAAGKDPGRAAKLFGSLYVETLNMLNARQPAWCALVEALLEHGALDEPAIRAILGPYPEVTPATLAERDATKKAALADPRLFVVTPK